MTSRTSRDFRRDFATLPAAIQKQARLAYQMFLTDPHHPSLKFKKIAGYDDLWSVRITRDYRAVGRWRDDVIVWFFMGSHADYENLLQRLES